MTIPMAIRLSIKDDEPFIFSSWLKSYRSSSLGKQMTNDVFFSGHHDIIKLILTKSITLIACNPELDDQIYGFITFEDKDLPIIHYVYVKHPFRGYKISKELINKALGEKKTIIFTHKTSQTENLLKDLKATYSIYAI